LHEQQEGCERDFSEHRARSMHPAVESRRAGALASRSAQGWA
jgi:hypothetical protein